MKLIERGKRVICIWSPEDLQYLAKHYADTPTSDIAKRLGITVGQVYQKAYLLELEKSAERIEQVKQAGSAKLATAGQQHRFSQGLVPWNKGTKGIAGQHPHSKATQFKKGRSPAEASNYKPIGSLRLNADDYLERKVSDDQSLSPARRWVAVHRLVWEAAYGAIAPGHACVFKPGMKTTVLEEITPERLEVLTRAELMKRNSIHHYPPELVEVMQIRGQLKRAINKRAKEVNHEDDR